MGSVVLFISTFGLAVGSFLNVVIIRGAKEEKITGRSYCLHCGKTLSWYELIPIASFLIQKGRCLSCGTALSWQYPLVEAGTAFLFGIASWYIFNRYPEIDGTFFILLLSSLLAISASIVILVADLRWNIIPNGAVITLLFAGILRYFVENGSVPANLVYDFAGALFFTLVLFSLWLFSRGAWIGLGDAKLIFATSIITGFPLSVAAFLFSFWLGGVAGLVLLAIFRKSLKFQMPFGPFILAGSAIAFFYGESVIQYMGLVF